MINEDQLLYILALQHVSKVGDTTAKKLINHCGCAEAVFKEKKSNLLKIDGIGQILLNEILKYQIQKFLFLQEKNTKDYFQTWVLKF